jgi:tRNA 5-methylaminomethyl-2-thiouridine biosynthesis bifunctional protein
MASKEAGSLADPQLQCDSTPRSALFQDVYHSSAGARWQADHVYVQGIEFPQRWRKQNRCRILELGFGLAGNFLATVAAWRAEPDACKELIYIAVEGFPVSRAELAQVFSARAKEFEDVQDFADSLLSQWPEPLEPGFHRLAFANEHVQLTLIVEPILKALTALDTEFDAVYLDGFAPAQNPDMWSQATLSAVLRLLCWDARLASYCVASSVRMRLQELGITVHKAALAGPKREVLRGRNLHVNPASRSKQTQSVHIAIIGAGIAGLSQALALARAAKRLAQAIHITLFDAAEAPMQRSSSAPAVLLHPPSGARDSLEYGLQLHAFRAALATLSDLQQQGIDPGWRALPVHELRSNGRSVWHSGYTLASDVLRSALLQALSGYRDVLTQAFGTTVQAIYPHPAGIALSIDGEARCKDKAPAFDQLILCNALGARSLLPELAERIDPITGQLELLAAAGQHQILPHAYCGALNVLPTASALAIGNSFEPYIIRDAPSDSVRADLLQRASVLLQRNDLQQCHQRSWVGVRAQAIDRRPLIGRFGARTWLNVAHGSKGFSTAFLSAEILTDLLLHGSTVRIPHRLLLAIAADRPMQARVHSKSG